MVHSSIPNLYGLVLFEVYTGEGGCGLIKVVWMELFIPPCTTFTYSWNSGKSALACVELTIILRRIIFWHLNKHIFICLFELSAVLVAMLLGSCGPLGKFYRQQKWNIRLRFIFYLSNLKGIFFDCSSIPRVTYGSKIIVADVFLFKYKESDLAHDNEMLWSFNYFAIICFQRSSWLLARP